MRLKQAKFPVTFARLKRLKIMHENKFYLRLTLFHYNLLDLLEWFRILLKLFTSFFLVLCNLLDCRICAHLRK